MMHEKATLLEGLLWFLAGLFIMGAIVRFAVEYR